MLDAFLPQGAIHPTPPPPPTTTTTTTTLHNVIHTSWTLIVMTEIGFPRAQGTEKNMTATE